jgi:hypothetical protein
MSPLLSSELPLPQMNFPVSSPVKILKDKGIDMRYTVIVPRVGGMFPFVNSLGLDGDYIYKSCSSSGVSQWMQSTCSADKP